MKSKKTWNLWRCRVIVCVGYGKNLRKFRARCHVPCLVCKHGTWQHARNFLKFLPQPTHTITRHLHKFHVFSISFAFYGIKKQLARNLVALPHEQVDRNFRSVPGFGLNLHSQTWMSFFESFKSNIRCTCSSNSYFPKKQQNGIN